jgi:hypothetical protein
MVRTVRVAAREKRPCRFLAKAAKEYRVFALSLRTVRRRSGRATRPTARPRVGADGGVDPLAIRTVTLTTDDGDGHRHVNRSEDEVT